MSKIGIISGSFDPITNGHVYLIKRALDVLDPDGQLVIVVAYNPNKIGYFCPSDRMDQIDRVLRGELQSHQYSRIRIEFVCDQYTAAYAKSVGATVMFRGIRNSTDFEYEADIQEINQKINPELETIYFIAPLEYKGISSSTVRGLVGFNGWEDLLMHYVHPDIINDFKKKEGS